MGNVLNKKNIKLQKTIELLEEQNQKYKKLFFEFEKLQSSKIDYLEQIIYDKNKIIAIQTDKIDKNQDIIDNLTKKINEKPKQLSIQEQRKLYKKQKINRRRN